ncbi:MAG: MotA/TolQ/ExbB proton channel family protein [Campylobacterota bacterium]
MSTFKCSANYVVISVIPVLFFALMLAGYLNLIPLNIPVYTLAYIGFILFVFLLFIKHNANYTVCKMRASYPAMNLQLKSELQSKSLTLGDKSRSILDVEDFLNDYYADIRNDNFVSVASSVFPMMGILGTFVAMAISMPNFTATSTDTLDSEISLLLSGVGSAFFASIYGILLSLIWTYFEKSGLSKIDHYFESTQKLFASSIWSSDELLIHKHAQRDIQDDRFIHALKETFDLDFVKTLSEQHMQSFKEIIHESNQSFSLISNNLQEVSADLKNTLSTIDNSTNAIAARNQIEQQLEEFTLATGSLEKSTKMFSAQMDASLNRTFEKIDGEIGDIVMKLADFATHVSLESQEVQESIKKYHEAVADQVKAK